MTKEKKSDIKLNRNSLSYWVLVSTIMISSGLAVFVILGILFFAPEIIPIKAKPAPEVVQRVETLSDDVASLNTQIQTIEKKTNALKPGLIQNRLNSLEGRLAELSGSTSKMQDVIKGLNEIKQGFNNEDSIVETVTKMSSLVTTLDNRVETIAEENQKIKSNLSDLSAHDIEAANMLLIATQFQGSVDRSIPFAEELEAIAAVFNTDQQAMDALKRLTPFANSGVPSKEALSQELDELSNTLLKAAIKDDRQTVRNTLKNKLSQYITVYQKDAQLPMNETQSILKRARRSFERGDVNDVILALSELQSPASQVIEPFINKAQAHIVAQDISDKLSDRAIQFIRDHKIGVSSPSTRPLY